MRMGCVGETYDIWLVLHEKTLILIIEQHIKPGSLYYTDDWYTYSSLSNQRKPCCKKKSKRETQR